MKELIEQLPKVAKVKYLLDTCFIIHEFSRGRVKDLEKFCEKEKVAMCSFNLLELDHVIKKLPGPISRHIRNFLKEKKIGNYEIQVVPGDWEGEKKYVQKYDPDILRIIPDTSDAVMAVAGMKIGATILTRDRHHVFTAIAENRGIKTLNKYHE